MKINYALWMPVTLWLFCWKLQPCYMDKYPACKPEDFHYEFTECDEFGGRWRVSVPKPNTCIQGAPNPPERANCTTSCEPGTFLDKENSQCKPCQPGTFSLGGGKLIDDWKPLPEGFKRSFESFGSSFRFLQKSNLDGPVNCTQYSWKSYNGDYISSEGGPCSVTLSYSVKLVKDGKLTFEYQSLDDMVLFTFEILNDRCQNVRQPESYRWPERTDEGEWRTITVDLNQGQNVVYWKTIGIGGVGYFDHVPRPVKIRSVSVTGVAYTSTCTPCPAGTFSGTGAEKCTPCPENYYSKRGSANCTPCNTTYEYSPPGSGTCVPRQPCTNLDYYPLYSQCDLSTNTTTVSYEWRKPKICLSDNNPKSISLPSAETTKCMTCNPGMQQSESSSTCVFCDPNSFSKGSSSCKSCPASTSPNYGINYQIWNEIPPFMTASCNSAAQDRDCRSNPAWISAGQYIRSGHGHGDSAILILKLEVDGFRAKEKVVNGQAIPVGELTFSFELNCQANCEFFLLETTGRNSLKVINSWKGNRPKETFSYPILRNDTYNFAWAFTRAPYFTSEGDVPYISTESGSPSPDDGYVKIFDIGVTNTIKGGASECIKCHKGLAVDGCIPCGPGEYFEGTGCHKCPLNTYVTDKLAFGRGSCKPCGAGLRSDDRQTCYSNCGLPVGINGKIDFSKLPKSMTIQSSTFFTSNGMSFHHLFNISLCGKPNPQAVCTNNVSKEVSEIRSSVCRVTLVPPQGQGDEDKIMATQAVSIGDWLIGVTKQKTYQNIAVIDKFAKGPESSPDDIHFYYIASSRTTACPDGRYTTVTLRCDPSMKDPGKISMPPDCVDGTCDGCSYHFLWKTQRACRVCTSDDYEIVKGECKNGVQTLHYIALKGCVPSGKDTPKKHTQPCSVVPFELQTVIASSVALGVLLLALLLYCWKKNRKLEYKYMKLVQSGTSKEGELPTAESCAIYDDDDDQYDAVVTTGTGRSSLLSKFQGSGRGNNDDNSERIHLTKNRSQL